MAVRPAPARPLIGIAADYYTPKNGAPFARINAGYFDAILTAGGLPILLPPMQKENFGELNTLLEMVSGIIMVGGLDLDPRRSGQPLTTAVHPMSARREDSDRYLMTRIVEKRMPLLAIGVSMQLLNIHFGGSLFLHLPTDNPKAMPHFDPSGGPHRHIVLVEPNSTLHDIYGATELRVNSGHHQAVDKIGKRLRVAARSPDGIIEAIEATDDTWFCIGTQWHPEADTASALDRQVFDCFVQASARFSEPALVEAA
ncbi:MAG: gamma-glutamyl-gamma-aminobutyrate hydrolase family protein [Bacteroidales bacterium]|nr:gamma-glutamyl-gamma-aminobutyrate hydrolase family protein [Bacteroidales bacterium]